MSKELELCIEIKHNDVSIERYVSSDAELRIGVNSVRLDDEALHSLQQVVNAFVAASQPNKEI